MKTRKEITKTILKGILLSGGIIIACTSPYFVPAVMPQIIRYAKHRKKRKEIEKKKFYNAFYKLKAKGFIRIKRERKQIYISLTKEGKKWTGKYQIDDLKIKKSWRWNKKWHLLIFDIPDRHRIKREALRGKLKELGLFQLQKSVWICPYEFKREIEILRSFFGLTPLEMNVITADKIENDTEARIFFNIK